MAKNEYFQISSLLALPFSEEILSAPNVNDDVLIYGASHWSEAVQFKGCDVVQTFYPDVQKWIQHGFNVQTQIEQDKKYGVILCALPKQKEATLSQIADAFEHLKKDGVLVCVAANDAGGKRLEKWMKSFGVETSSMSKSKCRIVWAGLNDLNHDVVKQCLELGAQQDIVIDGLNFTTQPGIYGWNKIDHGSKLLTHVLPDDLKGVGADFGCGYGFLSHYILNKPNKIKNIYVADADFNALECAKKNLKHFENVQFQWIDLSSGKDAPKNLDFIVMNPPFHVGKDTKNEIGQKFITNAALSLRSRGVLYMVANTHLPYEKILNEYFSGVEKCVEQDGFKIFKAIK